MTIRTMSKRLSTLRRVHRMPSLPLTDDQQSSLLRNLHNAYRKGSGMSGDPINQTPFQPVSAYLLSIVEMDERKWN